jgi:F-type H+-transporting ATPase subunit delta
LIRDVAAKRYAEAAYDIAREQGLGEAWSDALKGLAALYGSPEAARFLGNSAVPPAAKQELVRKALAGTPPEAVNLALLLLHRGRTALGPQIAEAYQELLDEAQGVSHATVTSAVPLTDAELAAVREKLTAITGGQVEVTTEVDEAILGGLVVRIGDRLIDGSTRNRLLALKQQLAGARS